MRNIFILLLLVCGTAVHAQIKPFRFAFITDTHIGSPNGGAEEDLRRTVRDINAQNDIAFVVLTGDITELGTNEEIQLAKQILDSLDVPWYIIPGNHDTGWSESGGVMFSTVFGNDKFSFEYNGIRFLGCASGPYVRMSDGHVPRDAVNWLDKELRKVKGDQPVIFLNHYPLDNGLDNWYEITDRLRQHNTWAVLCGHGHANKAMRFEGIAGVMSRSNLRAKAAIGGYNLVDVRSDSMFFSEKTPGAEKPRQWTTISVGLKKYDDRVVYPRPDYAMNDTFTQVKRKWMFASDANIISTPAIMGNYIMVGNQRGAMTCYNIETGKQKWSFPTRGAIFSSPAIAGNRVIFGSGDGSIYCIDGKNGKRIWETATGTSVLGSPLLKGDTVFIGGSDNSFRALDVKSGKTIWSFSELNGPVVSTPIWYGGNIIFGAWDRNLYALNSATGKAAWKWNNGSTVINYSPAACIPVAHNGVIYIVAPDRFISAIDAVNGETLWRNNDTRVRESIGISADGKWVYGKTMQDTIAVYATSREKQNATYKIDCGFGYEHVPSMLVEKAGLVYFGTKSGVVFCMNPNTQKVIWKHKIDNSMVNTVQVIDEHSLIASTMDGKVALLSF